MSSSRFTCCVAIVAIVGWSSVTLAQEVDTRFAINRFAIEGNSLLTVADIEGLVAPFVGKERTYGDIQRALEALEGAYRKRGFGTVQVYVPEQELNQGVVRLQVTEAVIGKVGIKGNKHFDDTNIRAAVPHLREGKTPNMRQLSENIQLANENPARQIDLILGIAEEEGKVDARLEVKEEDPQRFFVTLDNTGTPETGDERIGVSYQNANLFNQDHVLTLAYITSPDEPDGVDNHIYSLGYRWPLYALGDSIDFIYAYSDSTTPSNVSALGSSVGVTGKGEIIGVRYNHIFPRRGEYVSRLVAGFDYKYIDTTCDTGSVAVPAGTAGCTPYTIQPLSLTYSGKVERPGLIYDYFVGGMYNAFAVGKDYSFQPGPLRADKTDVYSAASGYRVSDHFGAVRFGGSAMMPVGGDWVARMALNGQTTTDSLVSGERLGLGGMNAVRGYRERADGGVDSGLVVNLELYTPEMSGWLNIPGKLKGLFFYDFGQGRNNNDDGAGSDPSDPHIAAVGFGVRYSLNRDVTLRYDFAVITDGLAMGNPPDKLDIEEKGDARSHFSLAIAF